MTTISHSVSFNSLTVRVFKAILNLNLGNRDATYQSIAKKTRLHKNQIIRIVTEMERDSRAFLKRYPDNKYKKEGGRPTIVCSIDSRYIISNGLTAYVLTEFMSRARASGKGEVRKSHFRKTIVEETIKLKYPTDEREILSKLDFLVGSGYIDASDLDDDSLWPNNERLFREKELIDRLVKDFQGQLIKLGNERPKRKAAVHHDKNGPIKRR